jgi:RsiW-degrading membrane proteinase PrsW (M82 family)
MSRRGLKAADAGLALLIVAVSAVAFIIDLLSGQTLKSGPRVVVGLLFAVGTAGLWLVLFYRQDRVEQEPKHLVATVAAVAALAAAAVAEPLTRLAPRLDPPARWLVAVLVIAMLREFTKYLVVRLVAVPTKNVNERADGVIYGTAAGLGYAVAMNVTFVVSAGGADVAPGFALMTAITLIHAALGGLVGYLVARDQLELVPPWWLPVGLLVAATVDAAFFEARLALVSAADSAGATGAFGSWLVVGLALAVAAAIAVLLIRRMQAEEATGS